jgi:hypothetical protein
MKTEKVFKIELYRYSLEERYIIVDENGYDVCGEHYTLIEARREIKFLENEIYK